MNVVNANFFTWLKLNFKVVNLLLAINLILGALTTFFAISVFQGNTSLSLVLFGAQILPGTDPPFSAMSLDLWRFITAAFLHGGILHLLFNMYALYSIGGFVERFYGGKKLFIVYLLTALTGSLASFGGALFELWSNSGTTVGLVTSVGASGAVFGLVGLLLGNKFLKRNTYGPELNFDVNSLIWVVAINLFLGFSINSFGSGVAINNWAHIGGLLGGFGLGALLETKNTLDISKFKKVLEKVLFILAILLFVGAWCFNIVSIFSLTLSLIR